MKREKAISFERFIPRPSWDEGFMFDAIRVATRSSCLKRAVGAVLVRDNRQIASGYAGAPPSKQEGDTCLDMGECYYERLAIEDAGNKEQFQKFREEYKKFCLAVHGEANALAQCARFGISAAGTTLYVTNFPCPNCVRDHVLAPGIAEVKYWQGYLENEAFKVDERRESERLLRDAGVPFRKVELSHERITQISSLMLQVGVRTDYVFNPDS